MININSNVLKSVFVFLFVCLFLLSCGGVFASDLDNDVNATLADACGESELLSAGTNSDLQN